MRARLAFGAAGPLKPGVRGQSSTPASVSFGAKLLEVPGSRFGHRTDQDANNPFEDNHGLLRCTVDAAEGKEPTSHGETIPFRNS
jgi:hypothetical protein